MIIFIITISIIMCIIHTIICFKIRHSGWGLHSISNNVDYIFRVTDDDLKDDRNVEIDKAKTIEIYKKIYEQERKEFIAFMKSMRKLHEYTKKGKKKK